ncbi:MAG: MBL fold metallo-hydrolase [Candidatus Aminicenantes bacterium]|nr:MBL fold metallo-hydrolase [Candidatus Aminicenantes bacterium]
MPQITHPIRLGSVNAYLIQTDRGFCLIDTAFKSKREKLVDALKNAECRPGQLDLVIITHGDPDHADNAAFLQKNWSARIAVHPNSGPMYESGSFKENRKEKPDRLGFLFKWLTVLGKPRPFDVFKPDILLEDGEDFSRFGLDAKAVFLPGHSRDSVGVLTGDGEFFCGDLLMNFTRPRIHFLLDDIERTMESLERIKAFPLQTVHPGHGKSFSRDQLLKIKS